VIAGEWKAAVGDLLLGAACPGCGIPWWGVCPACRDELALRTPYSTAPDPCPAGFPPTVTSSPYDPMLRGMIVAHKERQAYGLTAPLGDRLALSVRALLAACDFEPGGTLVLVPVPSARHAVRERGFDATAALARRAARRLPAAVGAVTVRIALAQTRAVRDQAGLDARTRRANLNGGFRLRGRLPADRPVVLVDDLVTTGSSLTEAARVLAQAGVPLLGAATVAATERLLRSR
jgi:predicted amidophosphoribosyltransferase